MGLLFSHGFSFQGDGVGVVDESVKNGVGQCWVADGFMPVFDGQLSGDKGGALVVAVFHDLEEVAPLLCAQRRACPVIEDEEFGAGQAAQEFGVGAAAARESRRPSDRSAG